MVKFKMRRISWYFLSLNLFCPFRPLISSNIFLAKLTYCFFLKSSLKASRTINNTFAIYFPFSENNYLAKFFTRPFMDFYKFSINCWYFIGVILPTSNLGSCIDFIMVCYFDSLITFYMRRFYIRSWLFWIHSSARWGFGVGIF